MFEISGKIKLITDKQTFKSGFEKQEFVITSQEKYPQEIKFEVTGDKMENLKNFKPGDGIHIKFNIRGNEYNGKYFVNLKAWDFSPMGAGTGAPEQSASQSAPASGPVDTPMPAEDDLPF